MLSVSVGWHIYAATGNPFDLALVGLMQILPIVGLFIVSGWVVDHLPRERFLSLLAGAKMIVGNSSAYATGAQENSNRVAVYSLLLLNGAARAFYSPAVESLLPSIVPREELSRAVAINSTSWTAAAAAGPFIAGLLIAWIDTGIYQLLAILRLQQGFHGAFRQCCECRISRRKDRERAIALQRTD